MKLWKRWHLGRGVLAAGAAILLIAGLAAPASATTRPFKVQVVGGSISIGSTTNALGGGPACSDGTDNEYDAPFTPGKDGLIDYPADPDCSSPFDNDERTAGFQQPVPITMSGTIDDSTGSFNVPTSGLSFPATTLTLSSPLVVFVANATTADSPITGSIGGPFGVAQFTSLDLTFALQLCIPAFGCTNPPAPYGTGPGWTANCLVDVHPPNATSTDPAGSPYLGGIATIADTDYNIPVPTDASPPGAVPCAGLAGSFGLPDPNSDIALQVSTNKALGQAKSITVGNATTIEPGPNTPAGKAGMSKLVFPITVNTAPLTDLTVNLSTAGLTATEAYKAKPTPTDIDFSSLDGKTATIKAGKTVGKASVNVYSDSATEGDETMIVTVSSPSDPTYTVVNGTALGIIHDRAAANKLSVIGADVSEGNNAALAPLKPQTVSGTASLVLSTIQATDTNVTYCTLPITANPNTGKGKTLAIDDYSPVDCAAPKVKIIKAGHLTSAISIKVNQDSVSEPDEAFAVVVLNVAGSTATLDPTNSAGVIQIKTDD
jgi:hypothetical protein